MHFSGFSKENLCGLETMSENLASTSGKYPATSSFDRDEKALFKKFCDIPALGKR